VSRRGSEARGESIVSICGKADGNAYEPLGVAHTAAKSVVRRYNAA